MGYISKTAAAKVSVQDKVHWKTGRKLDSNVLEQAFVKLYAEHGDWTAKECARVAGYAPSGAANAAVRLLKRADILQAIEQAKLELGEFNFVVRATKEEREKLFTRYYDLWYREAFEARLAGLGAQYRHYVLNRRNPTLPLKHRQMGNQDYNVIHDQCVTEAIARCVRAFGDVNRKKKRYDKLRKPTDKNQWQYRSVKGCAY